MEMLDWIQAFSFIPWYPYLDESAKIVLDTSMESIKGVSGVYCIFDVWKPDTNHRHRVRYRTIYVGQGDIVGRLQDHAKEPRIKKYAPLLATWAEADGRKLDGIERFLANELDPIFPTHPKKAKPIMAYLPY